MRDPSGEQERLFLDLDGCCVIHTDHVVNKICVLYCVYFTSILIKGHDNLGKGIWRTYRRQKFSIFIYRESL